MFVFVGFAHGTERHGIYVMFVLLWYVMLCYVLCDVLWCHVDIWLVYDSFVYLLKLYVCVCLPMLVLCCVCLRVCIAGI